MASTVDCFKNIKLVIDAKHQWESVMDALPQMICLIDDDGAIIRSNKTIERWGLGSVTEVKGKNIHEIIHKTCKSEKCELKEKIFNFLFRLQENDTANFDFYNSRSKQMLRFNAHEGTKSKFQEGYSFIVVSDITQEKKAQSILSSHNRVLEEKLDERTADLKTINLALENEIKLHRAKALALEESEDKYTKLVENTLTGMYITDKEKIIFCNNRFAEIFDYSKESICNRTTKDIFSQRYAQLKTKPKRWSDESENNEEIVSGIKSDGSILWLNRYVTRFKSDGEEMFLGSITDITADKHTRDSLRWSERELKTLSQKLLEAQESERKRIALELHDSVGQSITAIKLRIENALMNEDNEWTTASVEMLTDTINKLGVTVDDVRRISMNLRPSMLDDLGLLATIRWFLREYHLLNANINVSTKITVYEELLPDALKLTIFRVIQESLNNISKHAEASNVKITLNAVKRNSELSIADDGKGFDVRVEALGDGFGLRSMRERVKLSNGHVSIESVRGKGTTIKANWVKLSQDVNVPFTGKMLDKQTDSRKS